MPLFLFSQGTIEFSGTIPRRHRAFTQKILLIVGRRRLETTLAPDGGYSFCFSSRRHFLWASLQVISQECRIRRLHPVLILNRRPRARIHPEASLYPRFSTDKIAETRLMLAGVFDPKFYLDHLSFWSRCSARLDPLRHYLTVGAPQGIPPHRWFDPHWYLIDNIRIGIVDVPPLLHYASVGWTQGRNPHPHFDSQHYLALHPELMLSGTCPLRHWSEQPVPPTEVIRPPRVETPRGASEFQHDIPYRHAEPAIMRARITDYVRLRKPRNKIAIYTCIIGAYDVLRLPENLSPEIDYHVFTDLALNGYGVFTMHPVGPICKADPALRSRYSKLQACHSLQGYDVVIYADANVLIRGDLTDMVGDFIASGDSLGFVPHPARDCLYDEAVDCFIAKRDSASKIVPQMLAYKQEGYPAHQGLYEANLFAFRADHPGVKAFFDAWWAQLAAGSRRDQLSLGYVLWKSGLTHTLLLGPRENTRTHPAFALLKHGMHDAAHFATLTNGEPAPPTP